MIVGWGWMGMMLTCVFNSQDRNYIKKGRSLQGDADRDKASANISVISRENYETIDRMVDSLSEYRDRTDLPDAPGFSVAASLTGHTDTIPAVKFSQDGRKVASGSADSTAKVWDVEKHTILNNFVQHSHSITDVDWNWDSVTLVTASDDKMARIWDTRSGGKCIKMLSGHTHHVTSCSFAPSGNILATASFDETVRLWDIRTGGVISVIPAHSDPVMSVVYSKEQVKPLLATSSLDGSCRIWASHTKECLRTIIPDEEKTPVVSAQFTPNNKYVLLSSLNSKALLFDFVADKPQQEEVRPVLKKTYSGHLNKKYALKSIFMVKTDDGSKFVVSGSEDHHVYVWELNNKNCIGVLRGRKSTESDGTGHCDVTLGLDASKANPLLATSAASSDCTIKLWRHKVSK